jgi:hypothetical protein
MSKVNFDLYCENCNSPNIAIPDWRDMFGKLKNSDVDTTSVKNGGWECFCLDCKKYVCHTS